MLHSWDIYFVYCNVEFDIVKVYDSELLVSINSFFFANDRADYTSPMMFAYPQFGKSTEKLTPFLNIIICFPEVLFLITYDRIASAHGTFKISVDVENT